MYMYARKKNDHSEIHLYSEGYRDSHALIGVVMVTLEH